MEEEEGDSSTSVGTGGNFDSSSSSSCPPQNILILLDSEEFMDYLFPHARNYQELNPHITIELQQVDKVATEAAPLQDLILEKGDNIRWDGAIFPSQNIGAFMEAGVLWDMSKSILQQRKQQHPSSLLEWDEVLPFFRYQMARFDNNNNQIPMIPLDGDVLTMYYRKDLFEEYNIQIPRTWEEYTAAAQFFHGKNLGSHGSLLFGSCISHAPSCANGYWTSLILSSMTQSTGTSDGFFFDPQTLEPLFGPALDKTLVYLAEQLRYGHSEKLTGPCLEANYAFNEGKCALTYNWGSQMTRYPIDSRLGDIGAAPTPGSTSILDRSSNTLKACTEDTCPHGIFYDDIGGIVNHAPYSAFGGWAAGISNSSATERQHATMDFFSYVSNSQQSLQDILPNGRSYFAQPYRYSHVTSSNWIQQAGTEPELAYQYTSSIRDMSLNENTVQELRMPLSSTFRQIVDEEITYYLDQLENNSSNVGDGSDLRKEVTTRLNQRVRGVITTTEQQADIDLLESYQQSIGYNDTSPGDTYNLIDEDYRNAAWGLSALMCFVFLVVMIWIIRERNNRVMKAFQPFLLMQSAIGLFLLAATIIPLGLDDSLVSVDVLDITCMAIPWVYVTGFTIFFSSVYVKIRKCVHIYHEPKKNDALVISTKNSIHLTTRLVCLNGAIMTVWTIVDPLKWTRTDVEGGIVLEDGTVETYGICMGSTWVSLLMALILLLLNLIITSFATFQAFKCRFLVLEYNEMQWLPLSIFPFVEVWLIGAPIIALTYDDPTILFVVLSMMIAASTICAGLSVFAQKDWYIRKNHYAQRTMKKKGLPDEVSSPGIFVLRHPTLESQKQLEQVQNQFEQVHAYNTELEVEIRILKDKFKALTASQKYAVAQGLFGVATSTIDSREDRTTNAFAAFDQTGATKANDAELEAMEQFERVWKMPDEDFEDENLEASHGQLSSTAMPNGLDSMSTVDPDGHGMMRRGKSGAAMESATRGVSFSQDCSTTRESTTLSASGAFLASPDSKGVSVYEDQESKEVSSEDPSRIEWFLNSCDNSEEDSEEDPEKIMEITNRAIATAAVAGGRDREDEEETNQARMVATKRAPSPSQLYKHEANVEVAPMQEDFGNEPMQDDFGSESEQDWSESEASDVVFKRRDEKELKSMIKHDDLDALEEKANLLAQSLKMKLMNNSQLANLSGESEPRWNLGKERTATPKGLNDLNISKITTDDLDTTRSFVVMSDSILAESPARNGAGNGYHPASMLGSSPSRNGGAGRGTRGENHRVPPQSIYYSNDGDSRSSGRRRHPAGESSAASYAIHGGNESPSSSSPTGSLTQNAGEPSEGDRPKPNNGILRENDKSFPESPKGEVGFDMRGHRSQSKKAPPPKTLQFKTDDRLDRDKKDSSVNKSFSISDWSAVGNTASLLQDWSDSHSTSSYAESSYAESCSSLEATTRASALDTPLANEIDKLVANLDWEGVKHAATKFETSAVEDHRNLSIQEKRRKKRELEAWRTSISRSFSKEPDN